MLAFHTFFDALFASSARLFRWAGRDDNPAVRYRPESNRICPSERLRPMTWRWRERIGPGVTLLLLAPILGELVSGHQSPLQFLNPISFVLLALPYGFGALLCREAAVRWRRGWLGLLLLALAFAVFEEGAVARSLWDPHWAELGAIGDYSYWRGVTWTWAAALCHFHVTVSIGASILLAHLLYPARRHEPWLSWWSIAACVAGLALWLVALVLLHPYTPPLWAIAVTVVLVGGLSVLARFAVDPTIAARPASPVAPVWFGIVAGLDTAVVFVVVFMLPESAPAWLPTWPLSVAVLVLVDAVSAWLVLRWSGGGRRWDDRQRLAFASGILAFFVVFGVLQDLEEGFAGRSVVALVTVLGLWRLRREIGRRRGTGHRAAGLRP